LYTADQGRTKPLALTQNKPVFTSVVLTGMKG